MIYEIRTIEGFVHGLKFFIYFEIYVRLLKIIFIFVVNIYRNSVVDAPISSESISFGFPIDTSFIVHSNPRPLLFAFRRKSNRFILKFYSSQGIHNLKISEA
ncbi:hypothetical protein L1887_38309 [Cichorium endivia]|nr:hypothetical protein L1887_38309 [Cichorium endivia]